MYNCNQVFLGKRELDLRVDFLTFKDGKVLEINPEVIICNIARHKLIEYRENWKAEESDK